MNRRKVLKAIGIGASGAVVSNSVTASEQSPLNTGMPDHLVVRELEGVKRDNVISQIQSDKAAKSVLENIRKRGWKIHWDDIIARQVVDRAENYVYDYVIAIPSKEGGEELDEEEMVFWWFGNANTDLGLEHHTYAHHVWNQPNVSSESESLWLKQNQGKALLPTEGDIVEREIEFKSSNEIGTNAYMPDPGGGGGSDGCEIDIELVPGIGWSCFAAIIGGLVTSIAACGSCVISLNPVACLACAIGVGLTATAFRDCRDSWTDAVHITECVDDSFFGKDEWVSSCSDYWVYNDDKMLMTFDFYEEEVTPFLC